MLTDYIKIMQYINNEQIRGQRHLLKYTDLSLGKINKILKELTEQKYICKEEREGAYSLTVEGRYYLRTTLRQFKKTRLHIGKNEKNVIKKAVILAAGKTKDFDRPVGCLEVQNKMIIQHSIECLVANGIEEIVMVVGYKKEYYEQLVQQYPLKLVVNTQYEESGNMYSLSLIQGEVEEDFLLVESDLVFHHYLVEQTLENPCQDGIVITPVKNFSDEIYVELENEHIIKMSKDIHQLKDVAGEVVGICKISYELYQLMLEEFKVVSNQYMSYEYLLLDLAKDYYIPAISIQDTTWREVDNKKQYEDVRRIEEKVKEV